MSLAAGSRNAPPRGFRVAEVVEALHIPRSTIYALVNSGELPAVRFSGTGLLILEDDLNDFLRRRRTTGGQP